MRKEGGSAKLSLQTRRRYMKPRVSRGKKKGKKTSTLDLIQRVRVAISRAMMQKLHTESYEESNDVSQVPHLPPPRSSPIMNS